MEIPGGLVDSDRSLIYVLIEPGATECLDLSSGKVLARASFPGKPLAIHQGLVIGWVRSEDRPNAVRLFALARRGEELVEKWQFRPDFPSWVDPASAEPGRFKLSAEVRGGVLVVNWEAHSRYEGGAPPPEAVLAAETRDAAGSIQLDPETGDRVG